MMFKYYTIYEIMYLCLTSYIWGVGSVGSKNYNIVRLKGKHDPKYYAMINEQPFTYPLTSKMFDLKVNVRLICNS